MLKRRLFQYLLLIICLILLSIGGAWQANLAYARHLVTTTDGLPSYTNGLQADEVLHYLTTEYYRIDPNFVEPADPYHKPLLPLLSAKRITEVWLTSDHVHSITKLDNEEQTLVKEFIRLPTANLFYDAIVSEVSKISNEQVIHSSFEPNTNANQVSWISGIKESAWDRLAWVVKFKPDKITSQNFMSFALKTASITPQTADLVFDQIQTVWEIDQETGLLVSMQQIALTGDSPTLIYSMTNTLPQKLQKSELTFDLDKFISSDADKLFEATIQASDQNKNSIAGLTADAATTPEQVSRQAGLSVYVPDQTVLNSFQPQFRLLHTFYNPTQQCSLQDKVAFDFELCAGMGPIVKQEYLFSNSETYTDVEGIYIAQAPLAVVNPLLRFAFPRWYESHSISLNIMNKDVQGWQATIKNGDQTVNALFFPLDNTFVQINGYGPNGVAVSIEKLREVAESLRPVISSVNSTTIFIPLIQR